MLGHASVLCQHAFPRKTLVFLFVLFFFGGVAGCFVLLFGLFLSVRMSSLLHTIFLQALGQHFTASGKN